MTDGHTYDVRVTSVAIAESLSAMQPNNYNTKNLKVDRQTIQESSAKYNSYTEIENC